jgi:hypothetical protein
MPKAALDKDNLAAGAKNEIRLTWKILGMECVSVTVLVQELPHNQFRFSVLAPDSSHVFRSANGSHNSHFPLSCWMLTFVHAL